MGQQRIVPSRRAYNRWVADQTREDYALRFTAVAARRWSHGRVASTALGSTSFMALEAIGGGVALRYGVVTAIAAIFLCGLVVALTAAPIAVAAARRGLDIDLLTRGAGFGYLGSTVTSLIYATFTFLFFAIEASILAVALQMATGIPRPLGYLLAAAATVPMVTYGIAFISRFQRWSQPLWIALNLFPFLLVALFPGPTFVAWLRYTGEVGSGFDWLDLGAASGIIVSLIVQVGEQVDFLRFLPPPAPGRRLRWWVAVLAGGPGWIVPGVLKLLAGAFLAWFALSAGLTPDASVQPAAMYDVAYRLALPPGVASVATFLLIAVAQLKINVTNAYAGSIAWSNFFSRLTRSHPGRVVWVVFNVAIALLLMEIGLYAAIERVLGLFSVVACAWIGALAGYLMLSRLLLDRSTIEFKRAHLYDVNPAGAGAMLGATLLGLCSYLGVLGAAAAAWAPFLALLCAFLLAPAIAGATRGRFSLARRPRRGWAARAGHDRCIVCDNGFEPEDTAHCPAYGGTICSLCCSLDARCHDLCKPHGRIGAQLRRLVPLRARPHLEGPVARALGCFLVAAGAMALILAAVTLQAEALAPRQDGSLITVSMWRAFLVLLIPAGVGAWLLALAQQTRRAAEAETSRQTALLIDEIAAHRRTDAALQRAKEVAEAANLAKSRFVVGVSHELRTPLNAVLGYAQLMETDETIPPTGRDSVRIIRRSGEHLAGLIEGLLDLSRIETGRIRIERREVRLAEFLGQLIGMFQLQASARGIGFSHALAERLPAIIATDETRLRQILINLLSNAVKFTEQGSVAFRVTQRGAVTEFEVADTGPGIAEADLGRIFEPFERLGGGGHGIGLGLTITKLLTEVLGGEIVVASEPGAGSVFRVRLHLPEVEHVGGAPTVPARPTGYAGRPRVIMLVDDDATQRALLDALLTPLGFRLLAVPDGETCLALAATRRLDAVILDLSMPGLGGWEVAARLRAGARPDIPILVVSAHPDEPDRHDGDRRQRDAFLAKPLDLAALLDALGRLLGLEWHYAAAASSPPGVPQKLQPHLAELSNLVERGHLRGLSERLRALRGFDAEANAWLDSVAADVAAFRLESVAARLRDPS